jgi:hypothetical protein
MQENNMNLWYPFVPYALHLLLQNRYLGTLTMLQGKVHSIQAFCLSVPTTIHSSIMGCLVSFLFFK